jgi:Zn-dependent peptidase ImmA (M78 family)
MSTLNPTVEARKVFEDFWDETFPVDSVAIAQNMGLKVLTGELPKDVSGALLKKEGSDPIVLLSNGDGKQRKRFSCAHELGHYVSRSESNQLETSYEFIDYRDQNSTKGNDSEEIFANQFAANLLMPASEVKKQLKKNNRNYEIASYFGVSPEALKYRLKNLGLLDFRSLSKMA